MATLGKIRFETRGKINPAQWKVFLGNHDISHLVAGLSIVAAPSMPLPVVNLTIIGQVELPTELTAILQATELPAETSGTQVPADAAQGDQLVAGMNETVEQQ